MSDTDTKPRLDEQHPYPGLISFDEEDAPFFHGRAQAIEELLTLVELRPLTVLYGKSGLGKTSLLQAGLFPRLRRAGLVPVRIRLVFAADEGKRLAEQVRQGLREAIEHGELDGAPPADGEPLCDYFRSTGLWDADGRPAVPVLVFDQFEEIFTLGRSRRAEVDELMQELSDLVENRVPASRRDQARSPEPPRAKVLLALREDSLADLDDQRSLMPSLGIGRYRLLPLDSDAAFKAVWEPGQAIITNEAVAMEIVRAVGAREDRRPDGIEIDSALLALYCRELSERRDPNSKIDAELVTDATETIFDDFYDRCVAGLPESVRDLIETKLLTKDGHRDMFAESRLAELGVSLADVNTLINEKRLLRREPYMGQMYVRIVHDVLKPTIARRRDERRKERERVEALRRKWRSARIVLGLLLVAVVVAGVAAYDHNSKAREKERLRSQATLQLKSELALVDRLTDLASRATAERRWEDAARLLGPLFEASIRAANQKRLAAQGDAAPLQVPPLQALLGCRFEATAGRFERLFTDTAGLRGFRMTRDGRFGAVLSADGRSVTLIDLDSPARRWPADLPSNARGARDRSPLRDTLVEKIDWFAGNLRQLVASGDGARLFGEDEEGHITVWSIVAGTRLLGFRVEPDLTLEAVDHAGRRALFSDRGQYALVVDIVEDGSRNHMVSAHRLLAGAPEDERRPALPGPAESPGDRWSWRWLQIMGDGAHVVGIRELHAREDKAHSVPAHGTELVLVDAASDRKPAVMKDVEQAVLSPDGALLAALMRDGKIELRRISEGRLEPIGTWKPEAKISWLSLDGDNRALLIKTDRTLSRWDWREGESPKAAWELPLTGAFRSVRLSADGARVVVLMAEEAHLFETKTGALRSVMPLPEMSRRLFSGTRQSEIRVREGRLDVLTASDETLRIRSFGDSGGLGCGDRILANASVVRPSRSTPVPLTSYLDGVTADGDRLAILSPTNVWIASGLDARADEAGKPAIQISEWTEARDLRALSLAGGRFAGLDKSGAAYFGELDGQRKARKTSQSVLSNGGAPDKMLLVMSERGEWAAATAGGPGVYCWSAKTGDLEWEGDVRLDHSASKSKRSAAGVTALAVASVPGKAGAPPRPRVIVGDQKGRLRALTSREKADDVVWKAAPFEEGPHRGAVDVIEIGPQDRDRIASAAADGTIALWTQEGKRMSSADRPPQHQGPVHALRFTSDGELLLSGGEDRRVRTWKSADGTPGCSMGEHSARITAISAVPDSSQQVISLDDGGKAILWRASDCTRISELRGVGYAGFVRSTGALVTVRWSGTVEIWTRAAKATAWGVVDGSTLYAGDDAGAVLRRDLVGAAAPEQPAPLRPEEGWSQRALALSADGKRLLSVEERPEGELRGRVLAPPTWTEVSPAVSYSAGSCRDFERGAGEGSSAERVFAASWTDEGNQVASIDGNGCLRVWGADGVLQLALVVPGNSADLGRQATAVAVVPDRSRAMLGSEDGTVSLWDLRGDRPRQLMLKPRHHQNRVRAIALHPKGRFAASAGEDRYVWLWDAQDGRPIALLGNHPAPIRWAAFRPDGAEVVTGGADGWIRAWATRTREDDPQRLLDIVNTWEAEPPK